MRVKIDDTSRVYVHVGLGFHVELTLSEGQAAANDRAKALQSAIAAQEVEVARIEAHVQLVSDGLIGLQQMASADL